jgi:hypothetical protein
MSTARTASFTLDRSHLVHLPSGVALEPLSIDAQYWVDMVDRPELHDGRILSVFEYSGDWSWWERHPSGDELAFLMEGEMELLLCNFNRRWSVPLTPGTGAIVPANIWHSARVLSPSKVLFVTPTPARTEHSQGR